MPRHKWPVLLASFLLLFTLAGCALLGESEEPEPTPTRTPAPTFTVTPEGQLANQHLWDADTSQAAATSEAAQALPTDTPTPIPTETPTPLPPTETPIPPTPTPVPPSVSITRASVNVRNGPGVAYNVVGSASNGQTFVITGKNPKGNWWQIDFNSQSAWIIDDLVEKQGQIDTVQVVASIPPAPTKPPPPPATNTPIPAPTQPPPPQYAYSLGESTVTCAPNAGTTYFNGFVRDRNNNTVNGVCLHLGFYGPRKTKCSGCDGVGNGVWGFSPFGGPAEPGTTVEIFVVPCPDTLPHGGQSKNFGDLTPQSEKWVHTVNQSEQCTGLTFYKN